MKREDLKGFLRELSTRWPHRTTILLLGGAGAFLLGGARPTMDVDCEVAFDTPDASWDAFDAVAQEVQAATGIVVQYSQSIERWSQISFLDYRQHTKLVKRIGSLEIRVLEPAYWSIGKITRYWDQDVQDMIAVFRHQRPDSIEIARVWHRALRESPPSTQIPLMRRQALHFFETFGRQIWGTAFQLEPIQQLFGTRPHTEPTDGPPLRVR